MLAFAYLVTVLMFARADLYAERARRPGILRIFSSLCLVALIALVFALADRQEFDTYFIFYGSVVIGTVYIGALRHVHMLFTGWLLTHAGYRPRALLVGSGRHIEAVAEALGTRARAQVEIVGYISLAPRPQNGLRSLGRLDDLAEILMTARIKEVIIADPDFPQSRRWSWSISATSAASPSTSRRRRWRSCSIARSSCPARACRCSAYAHRCSRGSTMSLKRSFDLLVAGIVLVAGLPSVDRDRDRGQAQFARDRAIYRSERPGIGGRPFYCLKFRTMREHSDQVQLDLESLNEQSGALFKIRDDPRLTPVGRFLRRYSLDELPQLINVIRGEMSLVGPGRCRCATSSYSRIGTRSATCVMPGITGLWQVSGRADLGLRRPRPARLPLPRAVVGVPRPVDPVEDGPCRC